MFEAGTSTASRVDITDQCKRFFATSFFAFRRRSLDESGPHGYPDLVSVATGGQAGGSRGK